jgi:site-specific DNA-methyltransferase (adenine-specific)
MSRYGSSGFFSSLDALKFMEGIRDSVADIIFLDPPFNLGKDYGVDSTLEKADPPQYEKYIREVLKESVRALAEGGSLFLYHIPFWASKISDSLHADLRFRHWIAIAMKNGYVLQGRLYPAHYALLYFTKGQPTSFSRPRLKPTACRHCGGLVRDYGGYRPIIERQGVNLSDFWDDLSPVRHGHLKHRQANELPLKLTDRVMEIAGFPGALLLDPFVGSGTSLVSARTRGMHFIANDLSRKSVLVARSRLKAIRSRVHS